jgi:hypothetical protein
MKKVFIGFALSLTLSLVVFSSATSASAADDEYLYAGTWTNLPTGGAHSEYSKGIYGWRIDSSSGKLTSLGLVAKADGPESLAASPDGVLSMQRSTTAASPSPVCRFQGRLPQAWLPMR